MMNAKMLRLLRVSLISFLSSSSSRNNNHSTNTKLFSSNNNYYNRNGNQHQQQQQQYQSYHHQDGPYASSSSSSSPRPLTVALIGAGLLATGSHAPILDQLSSSNIKCVAVWSRNFDNAASLAQKLGNGAMPTCSYQEILESPLIDAVILTTPIHVQSDMVLQALQAGKHVLSEKPLAVNMDQALALVEEYEAAFEQSGLVWNVAGDYRYAPAVRLSHKAMEEIGKPFLVSLKVRAPFLKSSPVSEAMWRNQNQWYGGMIVEAFVHASCMLKRLFGSPLCVSAHTSSQTPHIPSLDTMTAQVTWHENVQGTVSVTYASTQNEMELEVIGSQGRMVLTRLYDTKGSAAAAGHYRLSVENASTRYHQDIPFGGLDSDILAFLDSIQNIGAFRYNTPQDALQDLELVDACLESGKLNGARILLPPDMDPIHRQEYYQQGQSTTSGGGGGGGGGEDAINVDHLTEDMAQDMASSSAPWGTRHDHVYRRTNGNDGGNVMNDGTKWHGKERL